MLILQQPDEVTKKSIYDEFNTTAESVRRDAQILKEWLEKQPHLPNIQDESFLANWLLRCKNSLEKAKNRLEGYYTLKTLMPCIYSNRDPFDKNVERSWKAVAFFPLPKPSPDGCRVSIFRIFDPSDAESHNSDDVLKIIFMSADLRVKIDCIRSDILVYDFKHFTMPVTTIIMGNMKRFITPGTKGVPMRQKTIYILNAAPAVESLITLAKSFIKKDLVKKVMVLKDSDLTQVLPKEILPVDYGGEELSTEELRDGWLETLRHYNDWFISEEEVKADNTKRIASANNQFVELALEDEDWLANILLRAKNDVERAKQLLDKYYTARFKMPQIFENRADGFIHKVEKLMDFAAFCPMPKLTTDGHKIILFHLYRQKDSKVVIPDAEDFLKVVQLIFDMSLKTDKVRGVTVIYDLDNFGISFIRTLIPALRKLVALQTRINPIRYNRIYVLNVGVGVVALPLVALGKALITKESEKIVIWKKKSSELSKALPEECLPEEYGGILPPTRKLMESYFEFGKNHMDWLRSEEKIKADLSKKWPIELQSGYKKLKNVGGSIRKYCFEFD